MISQQRSDVNGVAATLRRIEEKLAVAEAHLTSLVAAAATKEKAAEKRKRRYRAAADMRLSGRLPLPDHGTLTRRDNRLTAKTVQWAKQAMLLGRPSHNNLEGFLQYLAHDWNSGTYAKKPITFSGGYFWVDVGSLRVRYSAFNLFGLNRKQKYVLKNDGERVDFGDRPWWDWSYFVLKPVLSVMRDMPGFAELSPRFLKGLRLMVGAFAQDPVEVYTEMVFDQNETIDNLNRMLRRIGPLLHQCWAACEKGLRQKKQEN